jgi:exopolysaccharide biosynthesis polyprenyl glycosylphosphotransferase
MTMRVPTSLGGDETEQGARPSDGYLEVEVAGPDGSVTIVREWPEAAPLARPARRPQPRQLLRFGTAVTDWAAAFLALFVSDALVFGSGASGVSWSAVIAALWPLALAASGRYRAGARPEASGMIAAIGLAGFAIALVGASRHADGLAERLVLAVVVLAAAEGVAGLAWARYRRLMGSDGSLRLRTVIVGGGDEGDEIAQIIRSGNGDMLPVAQIDAETRGEGFRDVDAAIGLDELIRDSDAECVLVVAGSMAGEALDGVRRTARRRGAEVRVLAGTPAIRPRTLHAGSMGRHAVVVLPTARLTGAAAFMKRSMDLLLGSFAIILALPLMIAIGIAIKLTSHGPVFFRQARITKGGRRFRILKFRTMTHFQEHPGKIADLTRPFFKLQDDPRLTKVGRLIRPLSFDELPQLWNVLLGDMSLVGPRPLPAEQVEAHAELLGPRHEVRAGMTGWWQVNGRSDLPAEEAVRYDLFYIDNWSVSFDVRILFRTVGVLLHRRGAY